MPFWEVMRAILLQPPWHPEQQHSDPMPQKVLFSALQADEEVQILLGPHKFSAEPAEGSGVQTAHGIMCCSFWYTSLGLALVHEPFNSSALHTLWISDCKGKFAV